ncbi:hypothetical protein [Natrinema pallidum]|uniref:Uncharacterized protein n=1 Tax=Natrinema pallidum TaxID=69527 RepID=A0A4P9TDG8_9EURY|nr:hypothetical protein [Natrinema pallidum]QCW02786.1 hypothetical protein FGF80_05850 [Natrinema pallidum]
MSVNPIVIGGLFLSAISLLAFLFVNYDRIISRYISWRHTPSVDLGITLGRENFVDSESIACTQLQLYDGKLMFGVAVANSDEFDVEIDLEVATGLFVNTPKEHFDAPDEFDTGYTVESVPHNFGGTPPKSYKFTTFSLPSKSYGRKLNFIIELDPEEVKVFWSSRVRITAKIRAEATQFSVPLLNRNLSENIGKVEFGTIQREYEILGPHHDDVDMSDIDKNSEDTKTITIDGPTVDRSDGSTVCIGYYEDNQGRVISRFALPPGEHSVTEKVDNIKYLDSMDDLSNYPVDDAHKPEPPEPPWEE